MKEKEYLELFHGEALENQEEINKLLIELEKKPDNIELVNAIFRHIHTLKGNAASIGQHDISELAHAIENLFSILRGNSALFSKDVFASIYKSVDILGNMIVAIKSKEKVSYKGIKAKLEVLAQRLATQETAPIVTAQNEEGQDTNIQNAGQDDGASSIEVGETKTRSGLSENKIAFSDLVQVPVRKLDSLLDLVGELIIERDRIIASKADGTNNGEYTRLTRITSDLQYSVMDARLVQIGFLFNKFLRVVRDAADQENKKVDLKLEGISVEVDRNILKHIGDSLLHLVRNAISHGIEPPEERKKLGKPEDGQLVLKASTDRDSVVIEIIDDGKGFDYDKIKQKAIKNNLIDEIVAKQLGHEELTMFVFEPGFSTSSEISAISGRGVGMDVVKRALDSIGGNVKAESITGQGTHITLKLPSSMAVKASLLFELDNDQYAIPLAYTESVVSRYKSEVHKVGKNMVFIHSGKTINLVFLKDLFVDLKEGGSKWAENSGYLDNLHPETKLNIIVVDYNNRMLGIVVDRLLRRMEVVEKPLKKPLDVIKFVSGVTILGNGNACPIVNVPYIITSLHKSKLVVNKGVAD